MQGTNTGKHYLDYYSDWSLALFNAENLFGIKDVQIKASVFLSILNELWDADRISIDLVSQYTEEVNSMTWKKFTVFNN